MPSGRSSQGSTSPTGTNASFDTGFFNGVPKSRQALKKRQRELSLMLHPNKGGNANLFKNMMSEYNMRLSQLNGNESQGTVTPNIKSPTPKKLTNGRTPTNTPGTRGSRVSTNTTPSASTTPQTRRKTTPRRTPNQRSPKPTPQQSAKRTPRQTPKPTPRRTPIGRQSTPTSINSNLSFTSIAPIITAAAFIASSGSLVL